jgi:hypothetical protein
MYILGMEIKIHAFFILGFIGGEWSDSHFSFSTERKIWVERFGDFRIILEEPKRFKITCLETEGTTLPVFLDTIPSQFCPL